MKGKIMEGFWNMMANTQPWILVAILWAIWTKLNFMARVQWAIMQHLKCEKGISGDCDQEGRKGSHE